MDSTPDLLQPSLSSSHSRAQTSFAAISGAKVPPNAVDLERAVLGALMIERNAAADLLDFLKPMHFYETAHGTIYGAICELLAKGRAVDHLTVYQQLKDMERLEEVGGGVYLARLTAVVASGAHLIEHAKIVVQKYLQRELITLASNILRDAYNGEADVDELMENAEQSIFQLREFNLRRDMRSIDSVVQDTLAFIEDLRKREETLSGVPTGFPLVDEITLGWQKGDLIIIAARPSMGKTAFVLTMARNIAVEKGVKVAFFSLEMSSIQLILRLLIAESGIDGKMLRSGRILDQQWIELLQAAERLSSAQIFFDDTQALGIAELRAKCRRLKAKYGIDLIIIDYLQLMTAPMPRNANREAEVSKISSSLKALAKELEVPIIALAQLNRALEGRTGIDKKPRLSDLRESGSMEQDADIVAFVHRPERLGIERYPDDTPTAGIAEIVVAKHRNGETGSIFLRFKAEQTKFYDVNDRVDHYKKFDLPAEGVSFVPKPILEDGLPRGGAKIYSSKMNESTPDAQSINFPDDYASPEDGVLPFE